MDQQQLDTIVKLGEGYTIEFKKSVNSDLAKEIVAFANASGGQIFIGITDDGKSVGTDTSNSARSNIYAIAQDCDPSIEIDVSVFDQLLIINVKESRNKPHRCTGGFYLRKGANCTKLSRDEIIGFIKEEGKLLFDELQHMTAQYPNDLNYTLLEQFKNLCGIKENIDIHNLLINLGVILEDNGKTYFNHAGLLFFSAKAGILIPQSAVVCAVYKGNEKVEILDRKTFDNHIVYNIEESLSFLKRHLNIGYDISKSRRIENLEIPEVALREAVVNAIAHRNYFERGSNVMIEIFDNRVEITSPGGLPKGLSPEDFGSKTLARNPLICNLLQRSGYIEKLGSGIPRIRRLMAQANLPEPKFNFTSFFTATLLRFDAIAQMMSYLSVNKGRAARFISVMSRLAFDELNVEALALELNTTARTLRNDLDFLVKVGWLVASGSTKGRSYALTALGKKQMETYQS